MSLRVLFVLVALVAVAVGAIVFFQGGGVVDPSVRGIAHIEHCDGGFRVQIEVTNNLGRDEPYGFQARPHANFAPNPPAVTPARATIASGATRLAEANGGLVDACEKATSTIDVKAQQQTGATNVWDFTVGPMDVVADPGPPETAPANPGFSYDIELVCCDDTDAGVFVIRDSGSTGVDDLAFSPDRLDCGADVGVTVTVTGKLQDGHDSGIVDLGLRKDGGDTCHLVTNVARPEG